MSRQQKRAIARQSEKTAFQKICLAAGEGMSKALAFSFALASHAVAAEPKQDEPINLPPVVVEDQSSPYIVPQSSLSKFPEPLIDVPQSITIVPEKLLEEQAGTTLRDALRNVPGITATAGEGGGAQGDVFTLRGFNARNDMYIDGVRDSGSYFRDSFNFDSVEVLKGPSSTYFGRGSTGGVINQVSKTPRLDSSYNGDFTAGGNMYLRGTIDVNQPIPQLLPNAAFRINLMAHRDDVVERDKIEVKRFGLAPSIAFGLGTPTQVTLSYLLQHEDNIPDYGFPYLNGRPLRTDRSNFYGLSKDDNEDTTVNIGTLRVNHQFNDMFSLHNTLRYSNVDRESAVTNPTAVPPNLNRMRPQRDTQESILSNQTDLTAKFSTYGLNHTVTTGLEVARETFDLIRWASVGPNTTINNPNDSQPPSPKTLAAKSDTSALSFGIYAADQIKLNQYFDLVGGVRWDYFDAQVKDDFINDKRKQIDREWSYRGGLVFHPTDWQSYYFSYGTSFNPSAEGVALTVATNNTPPEKNEIFEVGAKLNFFGGALSFQGAVFRIDKKNARTPNPIDPLGPNVVTGKQRSQGFEIGLTGRLLPGLNVFSGYTFLDTEILKDNTIPSNVGNQIQNVPKNSANVWITYDFLEKWQIGGGPSYVDSRYSNNANTNRVPGFVKWDSTVAYQITKNIQFRVNAINLTNQLYFDSISGSKAIPAAGRTFLAGANFKF
ncbi:MAG TPA: TonB-dependent siderophore receptor [Candidatus Limnocylindrales bacterium]|nr:TonB-dependent siderophore receptor [Candidatus Limnocylindrales bacterium]